MINQFLKTDSNDIDISIFARFTLLGDYTQLVAMNNSNLILMTQFYMGSFIICLC